MGGEGGNHPPQRTRCQYGGIGGGLGGDGSGDPPHLGFHWNGSCKVCEIGNDLVLRFSSLIHTLFNLAIANFFESDCKRLQSFAKSKPNEPMKSRGVNCTQFYLLICRAALPTVYYFNYTNEPMKQRN